MRVCCRGNEQVHDPPTRLAAGADHGRSKSPVTDGDRVIDRQGGEVALQGAEPSQPFGTHVRVLRHEDTEVQLRKGGRARSGA